MYPNNYHGSTRTLGVPYTCPLIHVFESWKFPFFCDRNGPLHVVYLVIKERRVSLSAYVKLLQIRLYMLYLQYSNRTIEITCFKFFRCILGEDIKVAIAMFPHCFASILRLVDGSVARNFLDSAQIPMVYSSQMMRSNEWTSPKLKGFLHTFLWFRISEVEQKVCQLLQTTFSRWWFQVFFIFTPTW